MRPSTGASPPPDPTVIVGDERVDPFTETALAAAAADATSAGRL
ncbi:hypothetical protein RYH80_01210 [Halobaculum sp. MBLA0147]